MFRRFICHVARLLDPADFLGGWFYEAPLASIRRENVKDLVSYGFFYCSRADFAVRYREKNLDEFVSQMEAVW